MTTHYRNALLAGAIAALISSPGWVCAQQVQAPQADNAHQGPPTAGAQPSSANPMKSVPEGPFIMPSEGATHRNDTLLSALTPRQLTHIARPIEGGEHFHGVGCEVVQDASMFIAQHLEEMACEQGYILTTLP
jgi:hypothetical protein